jgi:transcriptional regulator with XRE-family HTH domain
VSKEQARHTICSSVAALLQEERRRKGLSMTALAQAAGLSQQSVSYIERGLRIPNLDTLIRITDALDIDLSPIIERAVKSARLAKK